MVNDRRQREVPNWQRQAWLTEYQALQHDNSASGVSYWTLAGIFIGFSSALLGGLIYAVLRNTELLRTILQEVIPTDVLPQVWALCLIAIVVGGVVIAILCFLRRWLRRVSFLQQINFERMRDIERELGMWKSWRVYGVDHWRGNDFDNTISDEDSNRLVDYQPPNYQRLKFWQHWRNKTRYEQSSRWHYDGIFGGLIFLWSFVVLSVLFLTLVRLAPVTLSLTLAFVLAIGLAFLLVWLSRTERV
ncbi:MAG: hypothetical protein ACE5KP_05400 [Dehalococcoidales bacterium]